MWQVGDSRKQNGAYNMPLGEYKTRLIEKKERMMMQLTIEPYEIIMMVNYAGGHFFGRIMSNKKAIIDQGWYPLNQQLLLCPTLRSNMTIEEKEHGLGKTVFDVVIENIQKRKTISNKKASKARVDNIEKMTMATAIKALGKSNSTLNVAQLKVMIAALRR